MPPSQPKPKREGPNPAHVLLAAISRAVDAGVEPVRIVAVLDMACSAHGVEQAPSWRMCARTLNGYADQIKPSE
jgi:hypothetical protein